MYEVDGSLLGNYDVYPLSKRCVEAGLQIEACSGPAGIGLATQQHGDVDITSALSPQSHGSIRETLRNLMRLRLVHTLSLLLLAAVLLAVLAMGAVSAWNLRNGFADYLQARDVEELEQFAVLVTEMTRTAGGLPVLQQRTDMRELLDLFARRQGLEAPPRSGPAGPRPVSPSLDGLATDGPPPRGPPPRGPPPEGPNGFGARVMLVGVDGQLVLERPGRPPMAAPAGATGPFIDRPVTFNGEVVALARMMPGHRAIDAVDARFLRSQYLGILSVAGALLLLALTSAWWVARRWARPLQAVQEATARIARGELEVRLQGRDQGVGRSDEIGDLARNVNSMAEGLQRLESTRRRWLAEISHELRTPLTVLRGEIEALVDGVRPLRPDAIASLHDDVLRLGKLIDDLHLVAISDLQSLPCRFENLDALELAGQTVARFADRARAQGVSLRMDTGALTTLPVSWDSTRIEQLLGNLLENSLRYTDSPGRIVLTVKGEDDRVVIDIDDSAPGVPAADLPRLFEPLYRADAARSRHLGGSGLGLAICHAVVRSHGGRIDAVHSAIGGLHLRIELPADAGAPHIITEVAR